MGWQFEVAGVSADGWRTLSHHPYAVNWSRSLWGRVNSRQRRRAALAMGQPDKPRASMPPEHDILAL